MTRQGLCRGGTLLLIVALATQAIALTLDERGDIKLGLRAYTSVRINTQAQGGDDNPLSFPESPMGHVRQHRYFLQVKYDHNLKHAATEGIGVMRTLFGWWNPDELSYSLQYRGEGEGIYDYGPNEFSDPGDALWKFRAQAPDLPSLGSSTKLDPRYIRGRVSLLRRIGRQRHRFFAGYLDVGKGPVFFRIGRQVLAWGETDIFRLLDNINPLDAGFGGFLVALDERRVPIDMIRGSYRFGSIGPLNDAFLEGFAAVGNKVATFPGIPNGSAWSPGGLAYPNQVLKTTADLPAREDLRGGGRFVFNLGDGTFSLAHYYTYLDVPGVRFRIPGKNSQSTLGNPTFDSPIKAIQRFPRVPITGGSVTFPVPSWYTVVRGEAAFINNEPMNRQGRLTNAMDSARFPGQAGYRRLVEANNIEGGLDPFSYPGFFTFVGVPPAGQKVRTRPLQGLLMQRDTFNTAIGFDINRFVRWLNPGATFFVSTQFFYKHIFDSPGDLVLPVPYSNNRVPAAFPLIGKNALGCTDFPGGPKRSCRVRPRLFHLEDDQFIHTLLITTSYSAGRIIPALGMLYDWQGALAVQPGVTLVRDPFRFVVEYTGIFGPPTGQIGTLRDRDNVRFQVEYVF